MNGQPRTSAGDLDEAELRPDEAVESETARVRRERAEWCVE